MAPNYTVSLVIPAFNVESYIDKCLDSVRQQSVPFSEVIVVDDGSTDGTFDVINKYSDLPQPKFIKTPNCGLGAARNLGASLASSEFLLFLDSDDFIHSQLVKSFFDALSKNHKLDFYGFSVAAVDDNKLDIVDPNFLRYACDNVGIGDEIFSDLIVEGGFHSSAWSYVFRRSLINWKTDGFLNIIHEDEEFTPRIFIKSKTMHLTPKTLYFYRLRADSIMRRSSFSIAKFLRSRHGYAVSLFSCLCLMVYAIGNDKLFYALFIRSRYLAYHAFFPFLRIVASAFVSPKRLLHIHK